MTECKLAYSYHHLTVTILILLDRWDVKCCKAADICPSDCYLSYCLNDLQEDIDYCAKENGVFVGIYSDFDPTDL